MDEIPQFNRSKDFLQEISEQNLLKDKSPPKKNINRNKNPT